MRVVIAPDKFKGTLSAQEVIDALSEGLESVKVTVTGQPMADGGEGTLEAALAAGFSKRSASVAGPLGAPVEAAFAVRDSHAVIELAAASGLQLLPSDKRDALRATSRGTGDLIRAALDDGCTRVTLAIGGSACTDGGAGMLAALGARFLAGGEPIAGGGGALDDLDGVDLSELDSRLAGCEVILASDVDNPLLGERGAAAVFAPQKGATDDDVARLEAGLGRLVEALASELGDGARSASEEPGAGAAGGVGYATLAVLNARREAGIDVVLELTGFAELIKGADLVITGEGSLDEQSLSGKTPVGVARAAAAAGVPVVAVCGRSELSDDAARDAGFERVYSLTDIAGSPEAAQENAAELLTEVSKLIAKDS